MGAAGNRGGEIHDPSPGDIASVSMVKVWPTLKDPEGRHIPEPGGDKGPNSQVGMTKHVIPPGSRKTKKEIQCVTNLAQTHNIEETVTRPPPKLEGTGNPEQYATFDRTNGHRQIPFKEFGHAEPTQRRIDVLLVRKKCRGKSQNQPTSTCIQREGESNRDWIRRHLRGVHAYR
jgi:hypothetical protein